jgi:prevent-host-death family protein
VVKIMGVREIKAHLSEVLDEVRDGQVVEITRNGRAVARLIPVGQEVGPEERKAVLAAMDNMSEELGRLTPGPTDVTQTLSDMRR